MEAGPEGLRDEYGEARGSGVFRGAQKPLTIHYQLYRSPLVYYIAREESGRASGLDELTVRWESGHESTRLREHCGSIYKLCEGRPLPSSVPSAVIAPVLGQWMSWCIVDFHKLFCVCGG